MWWRVPTNARMNEMLQFELLARLLVCASGLWLVAHVLLGLHCRAVQGVALGHQSVERTYPRLDR